MLGRNLHKTCVFTAFLSFLLTMRGVSAQDVFDKPDPPPQKGSSQPNTGKSPDAAKAQSNGKAIKPDAVGAPLPASTSDKAKAAATQQAALERQRFLDNSVNGMQPPQQQAIARYGPSTKPGGRNLGHFPCLVQPRANPGYRRIAPGGSPFGNKKRCKTPLRVVRSTTNTAFHKSATKHPGYKAKPQGFVPTPVYELPYPKLPEGGDLKAPE